MPVGPRSAAESPKMFCKQVRSNWRRVYPACRAEARRNGLFQPFRPLGVAMASFSPFRPLGIGSGVTVYR